MSESGSNLVAAVAAFGLKDFRRGPCTVSEEKWGQFISSVSAERLTGLALAAVEQGAVVLAPAHIDELRDRQLTAMLQALALERRLLDVAQAFEDAEIEYAVLKGPVLANDFYPDPAWRPFVDVDVLVRGSDWRRACLVLAELGFERNLPEPKPGFDERFGKAALHRDADGLQLDLHRTLVLGPFGLWMDPGELFGQRASFRLGDRLLPRLDDSALLLNACMHASLGSSPPLALPMRDVAQIAEVGRIDWGRFSAQMRRWQLQAVIQHAVDTLQQRFGIAIPQLAEVASTVSVTRTQRRALLAYTTDGRVRGGISLHTLSAIRGLRNKAAYIGSLLVPSRDFLAARAVDHRPSYLRRLTIPVKWLRKTS